MTHSLLLEVLRDEVHQLFLPERARFERPASGLLKRACLDGLGDQSDPGMHTS